MKRIQIAVIGASRPTESQRKLAEDVGREIAERGWLLINGGLGGVMEASAKGASEAGGDVVGVLPTGNAADANSYISIPIVTNMGHARNVIIVQSSDACIAVGGREGTLSEVAIALKEGKVVVSLDSWDIPGVIKLDRPGDAVRLIAEKLGV